MNSVTGILDIHTSNHAGEGCCSQNHAMYKSVLLLDLHYNSLNKNNSKPLYKYSEKLAI